MQTTTTLVNQHGNGNPTLYSVSRELQLILSVDCPKCGASTDGSSKNCGSCGSVRCPSSSPPLHCIDMCIVLPRLNLLECVRRRDERGWILYGYGTVYESPCWRWWSGVGSSVVVIYRIGNVESDRSESALIWCASIYQIITPRLFGMSTYEIAIGSVGDITLQSIHTLGDIRRKWIGRRGYLSRIEGKSGPLDDNIWSSHSFGGWIWYKG